MDSQVSQKSNEEASFANEEQNQEEETICSSERIVSLEDEGSNPICRICYSTGSTEMLISPCQCNGSMGFVHKGCLEKWLSTRIEHNCELCHYEFETVRTRKKFWDWCSDQSAQTDRRKFFGHLQCSLILCLVVAVCLYFCIRGPYNGFNNKKEKKSESEVYKAIALTIITVFLVICYSIWIIMLARYHYIVWKNWRRRYFNVRIIIPNESDVSILVDDQIVNPNVPASNMLSTLPCRNESSARDSDNNQDEAETGIHRWRSEPVIISIDTEDAPITSYHSSVSL